jgi:hypothetical protein
MPNEIKPASPLPWRMAGLTSARDATGNLIGELNRDVEYAVHAANNHARLQARVAELEAAVRKAAELAWDASGEGFNGEYTPKVVTPKDIDAMLDEVALQALKPEAK